MKKQYFLQIFLALVITAALAFTLKVVSDNEDSLFDALYDKGLIFSYSELLESYSFSGWLFFSHPQEPISTPLIISYLERQEKSPPIIPA